MVAVPRTSIPCHPPTPRPPCPSGSGNLISALASESGSPGTGVSALTLASCENFSKLLSLSEPQFHHPSNDVNNPIPVELLGGFRSEPRCIGAQVVPGTIPGGHHAVGYGIHDSPWVAQGTDVVIQVGHDVLQHLAQGLAPSNC